MLVSRSIPNMFNGVSQQAASLRHVTQCELLDNGYASIATGLRKRPPTKHLAKLRNTLATDAHVHIINKSTTERYVVIILNGSIEVYDAITGAAHTVTLDAGAATYLTSTTPRSDFVAVTAVDYTFIANKTITTAMTASLTAGAITGTKQQFSALPPTPSVGDVYNIEGTPDSEFDNYYVRWTGSVWVESTKPGQKYQIDSATMPWKLVKTGGTTWQFSKTVWEDRLVGDDISNAPASFIGGTIKDIFYHRGRLGFISDDNVILSCAGKPFNFWRQTVTAVLDDDPVDREVSSNRVSILNHVVPFNKAMMLFSDLTQFQFTASPTLTPKTAACDLSTSFEASEACHPISAGSSMFFAVKRDNSTAIREYFVDKDTISNDAEDITAHVPTYIPKDVFLISSCTSEEVMTVLSLDDRSKMWVYKYYWQTKDGFLQKVQSAWGRFVFDAGDTVLGAEFFGNALALVIQRADGVYLEKMELEANRTDTNMGFLVHLDRRVELTGTYDSVNDWTTWTLPYADAASFTVVLGTAFGADTGNSVPVTRPDSSHVRTLGNYSAGTAFIGRDYTFRYRFSTIYYRDDQGVVVTNGKLKLRKMYVDFKDTGYFRAEVTPKGRAMYTYDYTGKSVGVATVDGLTINTGTFAFPVGTENTNATIDLVSDSYLPVFLQSATWEGECRSKPNRIPVCRSAPCQLALARARIAQNQLHCNLERLFRSSCKHCLATESVAVDLREQFGPDVVEPLHLRTEADPHRHLLGLVCAHPVVELRCRVGAIRPLLHRKVGTDVLVQRVPKKQFQPFAFLLAQILFDVERDACAHALPLCVLRPYTYAGSYFALRSASSARSRCSVSCLKRRSYSASVPRSRSHSWISRSASP
jgi:hypothetical protein